jgi:hypothetical protein
MPKPKKNAAKEPMKKEGSDIFIYRSENGAFSAHPSLFVIHHGDKDVQIRNLTGDRIDIWLKRGPLSPPKLSINGGETRVFRVRRSAKPGIYEYKLQAPTAPPPPDVEQLPRTYAQGSSSPKMIVDA